MKKEIITADFREDAVPPWDCPICDRGSLVLVEDSFTKRFSTDVDTHHPEFYPGDETSIFTMMLRCSNAYCKAHISCMGTGYMQQEYTPRGKNEWEWFENLEPKCFEPALKLFLIPPDVPKIVVDELEQSFFVFFKHPSVSLVSLRKALELLLSELGVEAENGRGGFLTLADRIKLLPEKYKPIIDPVTAIKWLGNDGAHRNQASTEDVLNGYDIFEHVLDELYPVKKASVKNTVDKVNAAKGIGIK